MRPERSRSAICRRLRRRLRRLHRDCEQRDPKGLYRRARRGEIADFTGITAPYEEPDAAELVVDTTRLSVEEGVDAILDYVERTFALTLTRGKG